MWKLIFAFQKVLSLQQRVRRRRGAANAIAPAADRDYKLGGQRGGEERDYSCPCKWR